MEYLLELMENSTLKRDVIKHTIQEKCNYGFMYKGFSYDMYYDICSFADEYGIVLLERRVNFDTRNDDWDLLLVFDVIEGSLADDLYKMSIL